jgi:hypothetical protein
MKKLLLMLILSMAGLVTSAAAAIPAVIVIRHAEELNNCKIIENTDDSTSNYGAHQRCLNDYGNKHAQLYVNNNALDNFLAQHNYSQITKVITIDPNISFDKGWPTSNPYFTIEPYLSEHDIKPPNLIFVKTGPNMDQEAYTEVNKGTDGSTLIVWEKKELDKSGGLLDLLSKKSEARNTLRDTLYVFTNNQNNKYDMTIYSGFFTGTFTDNKDLNTYRRTITGILTTDLFKHATDIDDMIFCPGVNMEKSPTGCP